MRALLVLLAIASATTAQVWRSGDNSTVSGCSADCSILGAGYLTCWQNSLNFFETHLMVQLRHYISTQIDIDQWHRRHGMPKGQDFDVVAKQMQDSFVGQLRSKDEVLEESVVKRVAKTLSDRVKDIATNSMDKVPHYECPLPCDYEFDAYRILFITSMVLNGVLAIAIIPTFIRSLRSEDDGEKAPLQPPPEAEESS